MLTNKMHTLCILLVNIAQIRNIFLNFITLKKIKILYQISYNNIFKIHLKMLCMGTKHY
jgi:hypothetical protein